MKDLEPYGEREKRIQEILNHPLESDEDIRHLMTLIDAEGAEQMELALDE